MAITALATAAVKVEAESGGEIGFRSGCNSGSYGCEHRGKIVGGVSCDQIGGN